MNKDLECPYCEEWNEVCHDDGGGYAEDQAHEMQCRHCAKNFVFHTSISFNYHPQKADCLNGAPHRFTEWRRLWQQNRVETQRRRCQDCEHEERRDVLLPASPPNHTPP